METKLMRTKEWHCWKLWELKEALETQVKKIQFVISIEAGDAYM